MWTSRVQKEKELLLLSGTHRVYGRKSCTAGGQETTSQDFGMAVGREKEAE